jgi:signal transduction histidine kinase
MIETDALEPAAAPPSAGAPSGGRWGQGVLSLFILVFSLFAVAAVLLYTARATRGAREKIVQVADPAAAKLYDLQRILALEVAAQRGIQLGGDPRAREEYRQLKEEERIAFETLHPLVHRLGTDASERYAELRARTEHWEAEVEKPSTGADAARLRERLSTANGLYSSVITSGGELLDAIERSGDHWRDQVQRVERVQVEMVALFIALAFGSTLMLVRVGHRMNQLTERSRALAHAAQERRREMERLTAEKERFIRGVTHDLKNPLGAIDAYAQLLEAGIKGEMTADQLHVIGRIRRATNEVLGTIHDLLELARAEAGQLPIERHATDPADLVRETVEDYRAALEGAGLTLEVEIPDELPMIQTDAARVREVLGNLLSNALKYTPAGGRVTVGLHSVRDGSSGPAVVVSVTDTGPGIPLEEQERIFDEFHRVAGSGAKGVGLGLAISRKISRLLGGDLTVRSERGRGTVFALRLPLTAPSGSELGGRRTVES